VKAPPETQLQQFQLALRDLILDARESLDERAFCVFIDFLIEVCVREAARCARRQEQAA
jgi:hypothetical protein